METKKSSAYLRAKKKLEILKGFYSHLVFFILVNTGIILVSANVFNDNPIHFGEWSNYVTAFFWGIGLVSHAIYVFFVMHFENNFLKRWEEKKIKELLEKDM